ncbi:MAG: MTH938/NDUFAF3 family protein [Promethearchaeia archaeon]
MKFNKSSFGSVTIDGKKYNNDVYLYPDGRLEKRDKSHSPRIEGHRSLSIWELQKVTETTPHVLLIGTGQSGVLPFTRKAKEWIKTAKDKKNVEIIIEKTPDILEKTNHVLNSGKKVAGIFHTTC